MKNVIIMADHSIGYKIVEYILNNNSKKFNLLNVYTNRSNVNGYWKSIDKLPLNNLSYFENDVQLLKSLSNIKYKVDYIFLLSWKHILPSNILTIPSIGTINLHYSLLPKYRGVYPVNTAIINGDHKTGITYHWVDNIIDGGKVLIQKEANIELHDTAETLLEKLDFLALKEFKSIWSGHSKLDIGKKQINIDEPYFSKSYFKVSNQLNLNKKYKAIELINLFRGKTFMESENLFFVDEYGRKVFISIKLKVDK